MAINPSWTSGARSVTPLVGDGWFSFSVPVGSVGVFVGVVGDDASTLPDEPILGFMFGSGEYRVDEKGLAKTPAVPYSEGQAFSIARYGDTLFCCTGQIPTAADGVPFPLPGSVVYTYPPPRTAYAVSAVDATIARGPLYLDASLLMGGDRVVDAAMQALAGVSINMELPLASSADAEMNGARIDFAYPQAAADNGRGASVSMSAMQVSASESDRNTVAIAFEPMVLMARYGQSSLRGASVSFSYPVASGDGPGGNSVFAWSAEMDARGANKIHAEALVSFEPMYAMTYWDNDRTEGVRFVGVLPPLSGDPGAQPDVDDVALASDAVYPSHYALVVDGAFASDQLIAGAESVEMVEDTALASAEVVLGASVLLEDVALASDELLPTASTMLVADTALAGDELLPQSIGSVLVTSGALAGGDALPYAFVDVEGVALAGDDALIASIVLLEDEAIAGDEVITTSLRAQALLEDAALAGDELLAWTDSFALLQDVAVANEQLFMKTPGLVAWVMNTDTGAVSWYDNWAFTSMAVVGGKVFAAGPDGLHVIGGDLDGAEQIDARVQFGYTEFGGYDQTGLPKPSEPKKRVQALWFGYHADGALEATVETYGQGYGPYAYAMAPRAADQPRNNRIVPGKGLNARYWRIGVANTGGCAFEVHSIAAEVAQSTRRL